MSKRTQPARRTDDDLDQEATVVPAAVADPPIDTPPAEPVTAIDVAQAFEEENQKHDAERQEAWDALREIIIHGTTDREKTNQVIQRARDLLKLTDATIIELCDAAKAIAAGKRAEAELPIVRKQQVDALEFYAAEQSRIKKEIENLQEQLKKADARRYETSDQVQLRQSAIDAAWRANVNYPFVQNAGLPSPHTPAGKRFWRETYLKIKRKQPVELPTLPGVSGLDLTRRMLFQAGISTTDLDYEL